MSNGNVEQVKPESVLAIAADIFNIPVEILKQDRGYGTFQQFIDMHPAAININDK